MADRPDRSRHRRLRGQGLADYAGARDAYGNELQVTVMAVADELAAAADLVKGKLRGRPVAVVRGLGKLVAAGRFICA